MARVFQFKRMRKIKAKDGKRRTTLRRLTYSPYNSIRGTNPQNQVSFKGYGFPDRLTTNLVYADSFILDPSAGTPMPFKVYELTTGFDPDFSLGGGQPTYWDQISTIYSRYTINGAKITATFSKSTTVTANEGPYLCGIQCSDASTLPTSNPGGLISSPNASWKLVNQEDGSVSVVATYSKRNTFPDFTDGLQARTNANPGIHWYAKVFGGPQGINVETPINVVILIEYNVTFSDVIQVVDV